MTSSKQAVADMEGHGQPAATMDHDEQSGRDSNPLPEPSPKDGPEVSEPPEAPLTNGLDQQSAVQQEQISTPAFQQQPDFAPSHHYIPSPPTVSPLSTPAVTAVHSTSGDNALEEDFEGLNEDLPAMASTTVADPGVTATDRSFAAVATTDDDISYPPLPTGRISRHASIAGIDPAAYMISMAQNQQFGVGYDYPSAIAPSDISLGASHTQGSESFEPTSASASQKLESFARIEFADSVFQMTTYAVIIGRDQRAMEQARRDERRELKYRQAVERNEAMGLPPPTPMGRDKGKFSKSYVSEEGGMLGPESDGEDSNAPARKPPSHHDDPEEDQGEIAKSNRQYVSHNEGAAAVDLSSLQPSASHVPFVGIHSPGPNIAARTKSISRKHVKIQFNERKGVFEGISMHRNGFFCDDIHYGLDDPAVLRSGARIQIRDVELTFIINGVEHGKTGAEDIHDGEVSSKRYSVGGKEMSLEFEHEDEKYLRDTSESLSDIDNRPTPPAASDDGADDDDDDEAGQNTSPTIKEEHAVAKILAGADVAMPSAEAVELQPEYMLPPQLPRRRGPGRPPKDGIMSKRERRLLKKMQLEAQESQKTIAPQEPPGEKIKRPVGRPRKNPLPEDGEKPEKRKYTKRKKEDGEEGSDGEKLAKEKKDKKVRPKSPPLDLRIEDYTQEQLQKPSKNYVVLIEEALNNGPPEGLHLKQIYKRITARYPWYYFFAETKGWESSVRHNLIGNDAFKKNEETNLWQRVPGIELDAGKKKKVPTPERQLGPQQPYYHNNNYMQPGATYSTHQQHPTYQQTPASHHNPTHAVPQAQTSGNQTQGLPPQNIANTQSSTSLGSSALQRQPTSQPANSYSSPYTRPSQPANSQTNGGSTAPSLHTLPPWTPQAMASNLQRHNSGQPSGANDINRSALQPDEEKAIATYKANMLSALSKGMPALKATQLVETSLNRALGLPAEATMPGLEAIEKRLIDGALDVLRETREKRRNLPAASPAPGPSNNKQPAPVTSQSPAVAHNVDAEIQNAVKAFRDTFINSLKAKTIQAEGIVDSAINQALGRPSPGKFKGWEQAHDLLVEHVTKTINGVRRKYGLQPVTGAPPAQQGQASQSSPGAAQQAPSASPAPGPPSTPVTTSNSTAGQEPNTATSSQVSQGTTNASLISRPGVSVARPSIGITRPGAVSIARPSAIRQNSGAAAPATPTTAPTPAPIPSPAIGDVTTLPASTPAPTATPTTVQSVGPIATNGNTVVTPEISVPKTVSPALQSASQPPIHKTASPAPPPTTTPSAGVIGQIMGQKRSLDSAHGPGSEGTQQPEVKKVAVTQP